MPYVCYTMQSRITNGKTTGSEQTHIIHTRQPLKRDDNQNKIE